MPIFHPLHTSLTPPRQFTYPFCYAPHELSVLAARELQGQLAKNDEWREEIGRGKMFGVLVVSHEGSMGYLCAFSGLLGGKAEQPGFVPPIYDYTRPDDFFVQRDREISQLNHRIAELTADSLRKEIETSLQAIDSTYEGLESDHRRLMHESKLRRDRVRQGPEPGDPTPDELIRESQHLKAELRRLRQRHAQARAHDAQRLAQLDEEIADLRRTRHHLSARLQAQLFSHFRVRNAAGQEADLNALFADTPQGVPPSGAGECCAPKLLNYAYQHGMTPHCMAEFWWGASPQGEIRHHLSYYPACNAKCKPILRYMLQGIDVEPNPLSVEPTAEPHVIYEDNHLIVLDKPAGMLSVPGLEGRPSVLSWVSQRYGLPTSDPHIVHRLDMDTSGLMVVARTALAYHDLQKQFIGREVSKEYRALVDNRRAHLHPGDSGRIDLPLAADPLDRPRQCVDKAHGRRAISQYEVVSAGDEHAELRLRPLTGRTHQLRVHCASALGLGAPILGDRLYGLPYAPDAPRLMLHAERLNFRHPITGQALSFHSPAKDFG